MSLSVKWFVDEGECVSTSVGERGHFFLRRKLPLPRPMREGCTALEAICCLVEAVERGPLLEEFSLEADVFFAAVTPFEFATEVVPDAPPEVEPRLLDKSDSLFDFAVGALDFPSLVAPDFESDFASDFASDVPALFVAAPASALAPEVSCEALCADFRSASAALV